MIKATTIFLFLLTSSCASFNYFVSDDAFQTVHTDVETSHQTRAEYYEKLGQAYASDDQSERAIENYRLSILHDSKRASAHMLLSQEYQKNDQNHLAMVELEKALELEPENVVLQKAAAEFYYQNELFAKSQNVLKKLGAKKGEVLDQDWIAFYFFKSKKDDEQAFAKLKQLKIKFPKNYKVYYELALLQKDSDNHLQYYLNIKKAYNFAETNETVVQEYVDSLIFQEQNNLAYDIALKYSTNTPFSLEISKRLAYLAIQTKNYHVAINEYQKQKSVSKKFSDIQLKIAHVYNLIGDVKSAEKNYKQVFEGVYKSEAMYYLSQVYLTQNRFDEALKALSMIPTRSDFYPKAQAARAHYLNLSDQKEQAMLVMHKAYKARSDSLIVTKVFADMLINNNRHSDAQKVLEMGAEKFPTDADIKLKLAYLYYHFNNEAEFTKQLEAALELNPNFADAYAMLSEVLYLKDNKPDEILYFSKKALALKSRNSNIKPLLTWALMQKDSSSEAIGIFEKFYEENPQELFFARSLAKIYEKAQLKGKFDLLSKEIIKIEMDNQISSRLMFREDPGSEHLIDFEPEKNRMPAETKHQ